MAGIFARLLTVFRSKANKALDKVEDPRETLDYSYQRQLDMLQKVRRGVADVATSRKRVELQMNQLQTDVDKMQNAASRALEQGREDLAREALTRKATLQAQLNDLQTQHATLQAEEEKLIRGSQRLQARVDAFRTKKETIKATYSAAEAQTRINEAFTGLNEEMGDIGMAITRAEDKTMELQARAGAMDELIASGAIEDPTRSYGDDITRELDSLANDHAIDAELSALKAQLGTGRDGSAPELESGAENGTDPHTGSRSVRRQEDQS
ncbi:PspA/IM30 family protein [Cutibacterium acnes]